MTVTRTDLLAWHLRAAVILKKAKNGILAKPAASSFGSSAVHGAAAAAIQRTSPIPNREHRVTTRTIFSRSPGRLPCDRSATGTHAWSPPLVLDPAWVELEIAVQLIVTSLTHSLVPPEAWEKKNSNLGRPAYDTSGHAVHIAIPVRR